MRNERHKEALDELDRLKSIFVKKPLKPRVHRSKSKWNNVRRVSPKDLDPSSYDQQKEAIDKLDTLKGNTYVRKPNFRRLLGGTQIDEVAAANQRLLRSARILERMVNQDADKEIALG